MKNKPKILIIDDEKSICNFFVRGLSKKYDVSIYQDPNEALKTAQFSEFDMAFIDFKMPGLNGIQLIQKFRPNAPKLFVVILTAFESEFKEIIKNSKYSPLRISSIISKPIRLSFLENFIDKELRRLSNK